MLDNQPGKIWFDGELVEWTEARVHVLTHTLHYGSGVFEGERAYGGKIFKMREHHQRLRDSAAMLDIELAATVDQIDAAAMAVIKANGLSEAYVRPIVWHGPESLSVASHRNKVHMAIAAWKWTSYFEKKDGQTPGIKLMWSDWVRPAPNIGPVFAKANGQYISGTLGKNKAEKNGYHDALMLDYRGYVAECTGANIFMVKDGQVFTPIADCFLNGITRQTAMDIAKALDLKVTEKHIMPDELLQADEVFITGTAVEIQPISHIGDKSFPTGPITEKMIERYAALVNA